MSELATVTPVRPTDQVKRDRWGRYLLPHPDTGKEQTWTRATTIANTLADRYGLEQWAKRNVALGIGARRDLYAQAAAAKPDDKTTLTRIVEQAEEAAASKAGANLGSALHRFTERIDAGEDITVPEPWAQDVAAYQSTMAANQVTVQPGWIEHILLLPELGIAGTCDRLCTSPQWQSARIADLKTGQDVVKYGMTEIALQLAIYAHADYWFDTETGEVKPIRESIDQTWALVMHLPVGKGTCTIYEVNIAAGWQAVQLALDVRRWRQRKDLAHIINVPAPLALIPTDEQAYLNLLDRTEWVRDRVENIKAFNHGSSLATLWSLHPEIPTFPKGGPKTAEQLDAVISMCEEVERFHGIPFGPSDPTIPKQTKSMKREQA